MQRIARMSVNGASHISSVAVVGAGVSGSVCAQTLSKAGVNVTVFDQGWTAPGGRTSGRQATVTGPLGAASVRFDQGCQFFRHTPGMQPMIDEWLAAGEVCCVRCCGERARVERACDCVITRCES